MSKEKASEVTVCSGTNTASSQIPTKQEKV